MSDCKQKIKTITQLFPEILVICYFKELWVCPSIGDKTQQNDLINFQLPWISNCMHKINITTQIFLRYYNFKELCNLIGPGHILTYILTIYSLPIYNILKNKKNFIFEPSCRVQNVAVKIVLLCRHYHKP